MTKLISSFLSLMLLAAASFGSVSAHAALFVATYSGVVKNSYDVGGVFSGAALDNTFFFARYLIDDAASGANSYYDINNSSIVGGTSFGYPDGTSPVSAEYNIGGLTFASGQGGGTVQQSNDLWGGDGTYHTANPSSVLAGLQVNGYNQLQGLNIVSSSDFRTALEYDVQSGDGSFGGFTIGHYVSGTFYALAGGSFNNTHLSIASVASNPTAVPEPASWGMMIAGFGLLGSSMRRQRSNLSSRSSEARVAI